MSHTPEGKNFVIRCRAIIIHEGKLLVVKHAHNPTFAALPGGHLEWSEGVKECMKRELVEELGVEPVIGRLLYVNTFMDGDSIQPFEFFFEIKNAGDYLDTEKLTRSHAFELAEILWVSPTDDVKILPNKLADDFKAGKLLSDEVRFL